MNLIKKLFDFIKSDTVRLPIWWTSQILALYFYTEALVGMNKPEIMPSAGAFATVFAWLIYTRQKGKNDDRAREYELDVIRMMIEFDIQNVNYTNHNIKIDLEQRDYEIAKLRYDFGKLEDKIENLSKPKPPNQPLWSMLGSSMVARSRHPAPQRRTHYMRHIHSIDTYQENIKNFKEAIRDHRKISGRFGILEGVAILYSAALSAFGAEFVRWVHS